MPALYEQIGESVIVEAITEFYARAFADPIISHLFLGKDQSHLTNMQIDFAVSMLGGPKRYRGVPLKEAHRGLPLKQVHFDRRQVLMRDVLRDLELESGLREAWMNLEEQLRPLIVKSKETCHD